MLIWNLHIQNLACVWWHDFSFSHFLYDKNYKLQITNSIGIDLHLEITSIGIQSQSEHELQHPLVTIPSLKKTLEIDLKRDWKKRSIGRQPLAQEANRYLKMTYIRRWQISEFYFNESCIVNFSLRSSRVVSVRIMETYFEPVKEGKHHLENIRVRWNHVSG